jgi:hypothetical protein
VNSDFYFGEFLKIAKIGQNYIPAKKTGYTVFTVLRPAQEYFTYMETSPLPVKGCKI